MATSLGVERVACSSQRTTVATFDTATRLTASCAMWARVSGLSPMRVAKNILVATVGVFAIMLGVGTSFVNAPAAAGFFAIGAFLVGAIRFI